MYCIAPPPLQPKVGTATDVFQSKSKSTIALFLFFSPPPHLRKCLNMSCFDLSSSQVDIVAHSQSRICVWKMFVSVVVMEDNFEPWSDLQRHINLSLLEPSVTFLLGYCLSFGLLVSVFNAVTCTYISVYNVKNPTNGDHMIIAADVSKSV